MLPAFPRVTIKHEFTVTPAHDLEREKELKDPVPDTRAIALSMIDSAKDERRGMSNKGGAIMESFGALDDPLIGRCKRHQLLDIITIAIPVFWRCWNRKAAS